MGEMPRHTFQWSEASDSLHADTALDEREQNVPLTPPRVHPTCANSSRKRRRISDLARTVSSPSHADKMAALFRDAAAELGVYSSSQVTHASLRSSALRRPISQDQHISFGNSGSRRYRSPYSFQSPPKPPASSEDGQRTKVVQELVSKEPLSSGHGSPATGAGVTDPLVADEAQYDYPVLPTDSEPPHKAQIHAWLETVAEPSSPSLGRQQQNLTCSPAKSSQHRHLNRTLSDKENISPTHSLSPIRAPITYVNALTPAVTQDVNNPARGKIASRFRLPGTPQGHLSLPPRRPRRTPQNHGRHDWQNSPTIYPNSDSTPSPPKLFGCSSVRQPGADFTIHEDASSTLDPQATAPSRVKSARRDVSNDRTVQADAIPAALATLSPAVTVRKKTTRRKEPRKCGTQTGDEEVGGGDKASGNHHLTSSEPVINTEFKPAEITMEDVAQTECDDGGEGRDGSVEASTPKVLRSGRVVKVLGESVNSREICTPKAFVPEAEGKVFAFDVSAGQEGVGRRWRGPMNAG